jgi:DNA repair protein RadC
MRALSTPRVRVPKREAVADRPSQASEDWAIERALRILESRATTVGELLSDPQTCGQFFRLRLGDEVREHFEVAFLDSQHRLIAVERLFSGSIQATEVHPRIVIQRALSLNAAAVLLAHNHPSGHAEPSPADRALTLRLREALALVDVRVLDHFVVTTGQAVSMATRGLM